MSASAPTVGTALQGVGLDLAGDAATLGLRAAGLNQNQIEAIGGFAGLTGVILGLSNPILGLAAPAVGLILERVIGGRQSPGLANFTAGARALSEIMEVLDVVPAGVPIFEGFCTPAGCVNPPEVPHVSLRLVPPGHPILGLPAIVGSTVGGALNFGAGEGVTVGQRFQVPTDLAGLQRNIRQVLDGLRPFAQSGEFPQARQVFDRVSQLAPLLDLSESAVAPTSPQPVPVPVPAAAPPTTSEGSPVPARPFRHDWRA